MQQINAYILMCAGTSCVSSGSKKVFIAFQNELITRGLDKKIKLAQIGCHGFCEMGPIVGIYPEGTFYVHVNESDVSQIIERYLCEGRIVKKLFYKEPLTLEKIPKYSEIGFYKKQVRIILNNCGKINPESVDQYIANDGYAALEKVLTKMQPQEVIDEIIKSELRGRGGGGFPTGIKWSFTKNAPGDKKYVICNADEGDPGAFMDRAVAEGDPHNIIEGMAICGYSIGADEGYIYCRAEYPLAIKRLKTAIASAEKMRLLGNNILGTGFNFKITIKEGAGAFICGEETALIASIDGKRGMPIPRPPFPSIQGLWNKPTNINNVETFANISHIIIKSANYYSSIGTKKSKGTKLFALTGKIHNTGLIEVPMGISMREVIYDIGGGIADGKNFKAVQIGGPSGGCLPESLLDLTIDYDSLTNAGAMMGSGGLVVMDESTCMVDLAKFFLTFTQTESCGKCTPCREGTKRMLEILINITEGKSNKGDIELLETLAKNIKNTSLCGLGQTAPNPVLSTLKYFRLEYAEHIEQKSCPAGVCSNLLKIKITEKCKGCGLCKKICSLNAISGETKEQHTIDQSKCIKCGTCIAKCPFKAIIKG